jgi:hypothetical protein
MDLDLTKLAQDILHPNIVLLNLKMNKSMNRESK